MIRFVYWCVPKRERVALRLLACMPAYVAVVVAVHSGYYASVSERVPLSVSLSEAEIVIPLAVYTVVAMVTLIQVAAIKTQGILVGKLIELNAIYLSDTSYSDAFVAAHRGED